ncbi:AAA family ATPase [Kitasatospora sp. NPDC048298]|uniref:AAA family ATPase n=1 Tax=Kitasatospora sp. NPDC048298 TaxID=3364049 RepID=UPI003716A20C
MADDERIPVLVGRQRETGLLTAALVQAEEDASGSTVLLRGEAGVGKSTLLAWVERKARERGFTVLRTVGAEAETDFAFGALHQAFWPLLQRSGSLSAHQRDALESAFGVRSGTPSGFAVGAAALALLEEAVRTAPVLLVLDDLHWTDSSSATVFAFLQRRCADLPLVIVGASRPDGPAAQTWSAEAVEVRALPRADASLLLDTCHPELAATTRDRVLAEAAGNPLALVELPRQLAAAQRRGLAPLPERLPLGRKLERLFAERLGEMPREESRLLLLGALATGEEFSSWLWLRAVEDETMGETLERIEADGLAVLDRSARCARRPAHGGAGSRSAAPGAERGVARSAGTGRQSPVRPVR